MGLGGIRLLFAMAVGLMALAATGTADAAQSCPTRLLDDWRDGRIDGVYSIACYRQTLAHLPEDVRVYSTAQADITRALQARLGTVAAKSSVNRSGGGGSGVSPLLVVAITAAILVAAGSVAAAVR
jgi:hypothetical protein